MWKVVYAHKGIDIKTKSPASPNELHYCIDHYLYVGQTFDLIQNAIDAIDTKITAR